MMKTLTNTYLGIEFGSTRIKAVLIDKAHKVLATGIYDWENELHEGIWTYSLAEIKKGLRTCYKNLEIDVQKKYNSPLRHIEAIGISAMMHGFLAFDKNGNLLTPFRTWRNNITGEAAAKLTEIFEYPIAQRWTIAHLYQDILDNKEYVKNIDYICTLSAYVHWILTGKRVLGIGDASGMFAIGFKRKDYCLRRKGLFNDLIANKGYPWKIEDILPKILLSGDNAGSLTDEGMAFLGATLDNRPVFCPPEGDAQTGMVATNSIEARTANVSAGTSVFAMVVPENPLQRVYKDLDIVTTPDGRQVAMAHSNNCTSDYDAWISLFGQAMERCGFSVAKSDLYEGLLNAALNGNADCSDLVNYCYISGEHITGFESGIPLFLRKPNAAFTIENFMRAQLFSSLCALRMGLDILFNEENVRLDVMTGHGGFFKSALVGQKIMSMATKTPIAVFETSSEGGAWGIALLASYLVNKNDLSLGEFLKSQVFSEYKSSVVTASKEEMQGFDVYLERHKKNLVVEKQAVSCLE